MTGMPNPNIMYNSFRIRLFVLVFLKATIIHAQIDEVSFDYQSDDLSSFLVTFMPWYHSVNDETIRFSQDDTLHYSFLWQFGDGNTGILPVIMHRYQAAGTYGVQLTVTRLSDNLRFSSDVTQLTVDDTFEVPNVFTPDGDGINDDFMVRSNGVTPLNISIFDRAGNIVFSHTSPVISWDGRTPAGIRVKPGVYYYIITSQDPLYNKNGFVHIFYNR